MSFSEVFSDKVDGQTVTAAELNQLKDQNAQAVDKLGDTVPGPIIFDDITISTTGAEVLKYQAASLSRGKIIWVSTADIATGLPDFVLSSADPKNPVWVQRAIGAVGTKSLIGHLSIPAKAKLQTIIVYFQAAPGHLLAPAQLPSIDLVFKPFSSVAGPPIQSETTTFGSIAAYQAPKSIIMAGINHVIVAETSDYFLIFNAEGGANAVAGLTVFGGQWLAEITEQDKG
jgi:hypothetical protein